ncbi:MAG: DUF1573 domain-containing protein [Muribaculaceae bacterium]|nr:DUF1573 domain-containing protein [Muribaculaceae bacterium]
MRRGLTIMLLSLMAMIAAAQPEVTWLERQHDFGVIREADGKASCAIRLVNTGDQPLLIVKAQAACGCTGINYPEAPIQPGDTAAVNISYNPSGRPGEFSKEVIIHTNTVPKRTTLEIVGNVIPTDATLDKRYPLRAGALRVSQGYIPFGNIDKGTNKLLYLSAYNASTDTMLLTVSGAKKHIHPALIPDTVPPAQLATLTVHYLSAYAPLWGLNTDTLTLSCQPLHGTTMEPSSVAIEVLAQVQEKFDNLTDKQRENAPIVEVDCDDRIDFGVMTRGETVTRTFTVTNKGRSPLAIRRVWVPDGEGVTVSCDRDEVKRGKTATVTVSVNTREVTEGILNVPLTLMCNDPDNPNQTIRLVGLIDN